jgi:two-component system, sensor histidine kinase and response regulator
MTPQTILIVDDTPANLGLLFEALDMAGYHIRVADSGEAALQSVQYRQPDLILLDVMMNDIDGFEVCRILKADQQTQNIPVIFMTALAGASDEVRGFSVGAVDYVTKPIRVETTMMRVRTHLMLRAAQAQLQQQNAELDAYARTVAHDLKNPLTGILSTAQFLVQRSDDLSRYERKEYTQIVYEAAQRCVQTVEELLKAALLSQRVVDLVPVAMADVIARALAQLHSLIAAHQATIIQPAHWPMVLGNEVLLAEIWINYLSNAIKYGGAPPHIEIGFDQQPDGSLQFWTRDNGSGLSVAARERIFGEFVRLQPDRAEGSGIGLNIVQRIADKLGSQVGVDSKEGEGTTFFFTLWPA